MNKNRARIEILSDLLSFPTISQKDWSNLSGNVCIGDLISLTSAPPSKWYVSWVRDIKKENGWTSYLLESIDDESLCWWSNVGINVYNRERTNNNPDWQWNDKQFSFCDRWYKIAKRHNSYIVLPVTPKFNKNESVTLDIRIRYSLNDFRCPETFPDWKKLTMKQMNTYYNNCVKKYNKYLIKKRT